MPERFDVVIVGAGQAGLAVSQFLTRAKLSHVILERGRIAEAWRSQRWDTFCLVTPNWSLNLPGWPYRGPDPDGFMRRDAFVSYLEDYAAFFEAPVRSGVDVRAVDRGEDEAFAVTTDADVLMAANVVIATSTYQAPRRSDFAAGIAPDVAQYHASTFRNSDDLPAGAVLVVGTGQSGCQIADELNRAGRRVFLSVGEGGRLPRRYRGLDAIAWQRDMGYLDRTVDMLEDPGRRFKADPHTTGQDGGRDLDLRQMAREGVQLLGRVAGIDGSTVVLADDLARNLVQAETFAHRFMREVDAHIALNLIDAPPFVGPAAIDRKGIDELAAISPGRLDLGQENVGAVIWATGFSFDFRWVAPAALDSFGYPVTRKGVTAVPGLYFIGLNWLHKRKSGIVYGIREDAEHIARHIVMRQGE